MTYNVEYWTELNKKKTHHKNHACFSGLRLMTNSEGETRMYDSVIYKCPIDKILNSDHVINYLQFLKQILPKPFKFKISKKSVMFKIETADLSREKVLLCLTAFRYLDEYPDIVFEFEKFKDLELEEKFEKFQLLHFDYCKGKLKRVSGRPDNMGGHGLMYNYGWYGKIDKMETIPLKTFENNFKRNLGRVHKYFEKTS